LLLSELLHAILALVGQRIVLFFDLFRLLLKACILLFSSSLFDLPQGSSISKSQAKD
jgi:hypothetical protein